MHSLGRYRRPCCKPAGHGSRLCVISGCRALVNKDGAVRCGAWRMQTTRPPRCAVRGAGQAQRRKAHLLARPHTVVSHTAHLHSRTQLPLRRPAPPPQVGISNVVAVHMVHVPGSDKYLFMERPSGYHPFDKNYIAGGAGRRGQGGACCWSGVLGWGTWGAWVLDADSAAAQEDHPASTVLLKQTGPANVLWFNTRGQLIRLSGADGCVLLRAPQRP